MSEPVTNLVGFIATCIAIELTPGPNMTYLAIMGATQGRRAGLAVVAGVCIGLALVGLGAALGLAAVIANSPFLYQVLRWAGVTYLLWLAWDAWRDADAESDPQSESPVAYGRLFWRGMVTNVLNPKAAVFYVAILPTFVEPSQPLFGQLLLLSMIYVVIATSIHACIVVLAGLARSFTANRHRAMLIRRGLALVLAGVAVWFAYGTRH